MLLLQALCQLVWSGSQWLGGFRLPILFCDLAHMLMIEPLHKRAALRSALWACYGHQGLQAEYARA